MKIDAAMQVCYSTAYSVCSCMCVRVHACVCVFVLSQPFPASPLLV